MTIAAGDRIPSVNVKTMGQSGPEVISTDDIFAGKTVILFGLPGAFTPTCSAQHVPGFLQQHDALKAKGIDSIVCIAVNDAFVMGAWAMDQGVGDKILMVGDGSSAFTTAAGLELDRMEAGMGMRCKRFAAVVEDGVVKSIEIDDGVFEKTSAESVLASL